MKRKKQNASPKEGARLTKRPGDVNGGQKKALNCGADHTTARRDELRAAGLGLDNTSGITQCETLLRVLRYLGTRGLNTPEGVACGYYRIATRIQELEAAGWIISSLRESIIGADGLVHNGIARYVLMGRLDPRSGQQGALDLGDAA